jgi:hypothetical protein
VAKQEKLDLGRGMARTRGSREEEVSVHTVPLAMNVRSLAAVDGVRSSCHKSKLNKINYAIKVQKVGEPQARECCGSQSRMQCTAALRL